MNCNNRRCYDDIEMRIEAYILQPVLPSNEIGHIRKGIKRALEDIDRFAPALSIMESNDVSAILMELYLRDASIPSDATLRGIFGTWWYMWRREMSA